MEVKIVCNITGVSFYLPNTYPSVRIISNTSSALILKAAASTVLAGPLALNMTLPPEWSGSLLATAFVDDLGSCGGYNDVSLSASDNLMVSVRGYNNPPYVLVHSLTPDGEQVLICTEDTPCALPYVEVVDRDLRGGWSSRGQPNGVLSRAPYLH